MQRSIPDWPAVLPFTHPPDLEPDQGPEDFLEDLSTQINAELSRIEQNGALEHYADALLDNSTCETVLARIPDALSGELAQQFASTLAVLAKTCSSTQSNLDAQLVVLVHRLFLAFNPATAKGPSVAIAQLAVSTCAHIPLTSHCVQLLPALLELIRKCRGLIPRFVLFFASDRPLSPFFCSRSHRFARH